MEKISEATRHLLAIINDILDLSKVEAGQLRLERVSFPLAALLDQVRSLISEQALAQGPGDRSGDRRHAAVAAG